MALNGKNISLPIYHDVNGVRTPFHNLVLRKFTVDSVVMSLGDKITGDVYYIDSNLECSMKEYVVFNDVEYTLVNPPTLVREGLVKDNSDLKGMSKYSFEFYHPMYILGNLPFTDVAVSYDEMRYKSHDKTFSWIGKPADFVAKLNKNLENTEWVVVLSSRFPQEKLDELSGVISFDKNTIADVLKTGYETWEVPFVVDKLHQGEYYHTDANNNNVDYYTQGKRFVVVFGLPSNEIYEDGEDEPFVFHFGQGVGLKNNSRTPRNNKIVTRIAGYGSENNIPYGYPQIRWYGDPNATCTIGDSVGPKQNVTINGVTYDWAMSYPIYDGIVGGEWVKLIKHPFTRNHLMPTIYAESVFNKVSQFDENGNTNENFNPDIEIKDYYDAIEGDENYPYINVVNPIAPSYEIHEFDDIKPELGEAYILGATPINNDLTDADDWDDTMDDDGNYLQSYFKIQLPQLTFDIYACAAITQEMEINMRSGACIGCTFTVQVDWEDYKRNFYDSNMNFAPNGQQRDYTRYPDSRLGSISVIVQKDINTFGTLMPNIYQHPRGIEYENGEISYAGDAFVVLGISLPLSYITSAHERLDDAMKSYMLENNIYYYDYPLKFDEHFLANHIVILNQIRPNTIIRFEFNDEPMELFVKQLTIKFNENKLPQYDITLTDNIEVVLNQIGQVADDVEHLGTLIAILRQQYGKNVLVELANKLSRMDDDSARGLITFLKGLDVGQYMSGFLGSGAHIGANGNGEFNEITVRGAFRAAEMIFNLISAEEGESIRSIGHGEILTVNPLGLIGTATLKLEGDEWATIKAGDICRGVYNTIDKDIDNSDVEDGFDDNGFRTTKGVFSSYFRIVAVQSSKGSCSFSYVLQQDGSGAIATEHPCPLMRFVVYGNNHKKNGVYDMKERQSSLYTTAVGISPRILFLTGVDDFKIKPQNIKIALGNLDGIKVLEELENASEYNNNSDPDKFTETIDGVIHYYAHKTLEGDAGFYCEDNIYLGGIINQFKAAALEAITSEIGTLGKAWVSPSVDTFVVECDENSNVDGNQTLDLSAYLYYNNSALVLDRIYCEFRYGDVVSRPTLSDSNKKASMSYTFNDGDAFMSGSITINLTSIDMSGTRYSDLRTVALIANRRGHRGDTGAMVRFLGDWNDTLSPVWNDIFRDCVKHSGTYWLVDVLSDGTIPLGEPSSTNHNWENIGAMRFVATELLLAEEATINNLVATKIQTGALMTPHVRIEGSVMEFYGKLPFPNIVLGVDDDDCAVLKFYDKNGNFKFDLGPEGLIYLDSVENSFSNVLLLDITELASTKVTSGLLMLMNVTDESCDTYYKFKEGFVTLGNEKRYKISNSSVPSTYDGKLFTTNGMSSSTPSIPSGSQVTGWFISPNYGQYAVARVGNVEYNCVFAIYYANGNVLGSVPILFKNEHDWWRDENGSIRGGLSSGTSLLDYLDFKLNLTP